MSALRSRLSFIGANVWELKRPKHANMRYDQRPILVCTYRKYFSQWRLCPPYVLLKDPGLRYYKRRLHTNHKAFDFALPAEGGKTVIFVYVQRTLFSNRMITEYSWKLLQRPPPGSSRRPSARALVEPKHLSSHFRPYPPRPPSFRQHAPPRRQTDSH